MAVSERIIANTRDLLFRPEVGRGIVVGRIGDFAVLMCWLKGKDVTERDLAFTLEAGRVVVRPYREQRPTEQLPYYAMAEVALDSGSATGQLEPDAVNKDATRTVHFATNGRFTGYMMEDLRVGRGFYGSVIYQGVAWTAIERPKLSAGIDVGQETKVAIAVSTKDRGGETVRHFKQGILDEIIEDATGYCVHEYRGDRGSKPFNREPYQVWLPGELDDTVEQYYTALYPHASVAAKAIDMTTGQTVRHIIMNDQEIL
jgi:hypothetical protein